MDVELELKSATTETFRVEMDAVQIVYRLMMGGRAEVDP